MEVIDGMLLAIAAVLLLGVTAAQSQQPVTVKGLLAGRASFCRRRTSFSSVT
jgi:hypothetical protein